MIKDGETKNSGAYEYDSMNRLTKLDNGDNIYSYLYYKDGKLRAVRSSGTNNSELSLTYNNANLPTRYQVNIGGKKRDYFISYYLNGLKYLEQDSANNITKDYGYTSRGQLEYEEWMTPYENAMIDYSYDASGNRTRKTEYYYDTSTKEITDYTYDANNRLMQAVITSGVPFSGTGGDLAAMTRYYYDPNGNTLAEQNKVYMSNMSNVDTGSEMILSGRSSGKLMKVYEYDDFNRLIKYRDGGKEAEYRYTTDNLRASKTVNGQKTDFVWNGQNLAGETKRNVTTTYTYDMRGVIASKKNGAVTRYVKDPHGNVIGTSKNNELVGEYDYTAFGIELQSSGPSNPFRYCGEYYDTELDSVYLRNRYYNPATGRFLTEDPVKDGMNWYSYCGGEPVMAWDPSGCINYDYYIKNFDGEDQTLSNEAKRRLAEYQDAYVSGEHYWSHKSANLLRKLDHAFQNHFGYKYSWAASKAPNTMDKISALSSSIGETASAYNIPTEVISAILAREITCYIPGEDFLGSSVGIAQINPSTVLTSWRSYFGTDAGFDESTVKKALKSDDNYSVRMCGLIIADIAKQKGINLNNANKSDIISVIARYNGTGDDAQRYGREAYEYYSAYKSYYSVN